MRGNTVKMNFGGSLCKSTRGYWIYQRGTGATRVRISTKEIEFDRAVVEAERLSNRSVVSIGSGFGKAYPGDYWDVYKNTRKNATKRGILFELSMEEFEKIVTRSAGICEVTGIVLQRSRNLFEGDRQPFMPSIDRISSSGGYTFDNVRIVCVSANLAMNTWGTWVLEELARAMVATNRFDRRASSAVTKIMTGQ